MFKKKELSIKEQQYLIQKVETSYRSFGMLLIRTMMKHHQIDLATAEDMLQITFERIMKYPTSFIHLENEHIFRFLYSVMSHEIFRFQKKCPLFLDYDDLDSYIDYQQIQEKISERSNPESFYLEKTIVHELISQLPKHYANILHLHYICGLSQKELSSLLGISENTLNQRFYYIRKKLRTLLLKEGFYGSSK